MMIHTSHHHKQSVNHNSGSHQYSHHHYSKMMARHHNQPQQLSLVPLTEVDYDQDKPWLTQQRVLPLLQELSQQSRWQLWLTPGINVSRHWLQSSGLPVGKILRISQLNQSIIFDTMINALQTGNYSVVIGWSPDTPDADSYQRLTQAAQAGNTTAMLIRPHSCITTLTPCLTSTYRRNWYH